MRVVRLSVVAAMLVLVAFASASVVLADGRVALAVGNSTYDHIGRLPNPENDAVDMAAALQRLKFDVTTELDADRVALTEALRAFTRRSAGADVSLVFYAGHGIEMDGVNYVVPVDARLERDVDVRFESVTLDDLLVSTAGAFIAAGGPGRVPEQPARPVDAADGGAADGERRELRGPQTYLEEPLELSALFRRVRADVLEVTDGEQRPHEYASLVREHYLSGAPGAAPTAASAVVDGATAAARLQQTCLALVEHAGWSF